MRRFIVILSLLSLAASSASALEIKEGRIKLVINEQTARFAIYYLADIAKAKYVPLFYDQEIRTTYPTLSVDQKNYKLGESPEYRFTVGREGQTAVIDYRSSFCAVRQTFSFVKAQGSVLADGVVIDFRVENISEKDIMVGLKFLLDTSLGERANRHFTSQARGVIASESLFGSGSDDAWVVSPGDSGASLQVMIRGEGITTPSQVILANWKRLNDAPWSFDVNATRTFTLVPYSVNDSAIGLFYEPRAVRKGTAQDFVMLIGNESANGFKGNGSSEDALVDAMAAFESSVLTESGGDKGLSVETDLIAVRDILASINGKLAAGKTATKEELALYREIIGRLKARKAGY